MNGTTCHWKQKNLKVYTFSEKMKWSNTGITKVKSYTRMAVNHCRMRLGLSQSQKSFILLYLYSLNFAKTQTVILYLKRPLILFSSALNTTHSDIQCTIIFPGTNYNTVIAIMPLYLCNILLQGSEDLSLNETIKKYLTGYLNFINDWAFRSQCDRRTRRKLIKLRQYDIISLTHTHTHKRARMHARTACFHRM